MNQTLSQQTLLSTLLFRATNNIIHDLYNCRCGAKNCRGTISSRDLLAYSAQWESMDTPGPFEKTAKEAYFNVTLPDPTWSQQKINDFMTTFNYPSISNTAVHEAYPGHYVQFLWLHQVHDRIRQLLGAATNSEGWAHYCEQMMLEEGLATPEYGVKDEREAKLMRLSQLVEALLRNARFIVGIEMHTGQMTFDQAIDFFVKEGYQSRTAGTMEAKRGRRRRRRVRGAFSGLKY